MKKYFMLFLDSKNIIEKLTNEEAGILLKAFYSYNETGEMPNLDRILSLVFLSFQNQFDVADSSYEKKVKQLSENGKKGGAPKGNQNAKKKNNQMVEKTTKNNQMVEKTTKNNQMVEKTTKTSKDKDKDKDKDKEEYNPSNEGVYTHVRACEKPTLSQVKDVCKSYGIDEQLGEKFYLHYQANGWVQGTGVAIRDWVAQLNKWVADQNKFEKPTATNGKPAKYKEREYSDSEFNALFEDLKTVEL